MQLTARTTVRSDVGPYSVTLPGYARANSPAAQDSYAPFVIESCRGDELSIDLENGTGQPINFHTQNEGGRKIAAQGEQFFACSATGYPHFQFFPWGKLFQGCIPIQSIWLVVTAPAPPASPFCSVIRNALAVWFETNSPVSAALVPWPMPALQLTA